jgi:Flp pilus assembly protein TadG
MQYHLQILRRTEGAEIAEAAVVLPIVFLFLMGIIWFGRAFNIYSTVQQAAQQGAITAARPSCASCGNAFPGNGTVQTAIENVLQANNLDPTNMKPITLTGTGCRTHAGKFTICKQVLLNSSPQPQTCSTQPTPTQICGTIIAFKYPFSFSLPFTSLDWSTIYLGAQAQSRMEN